MSGVILLVDDEPLVTEGLSRALFAEPLRFLTANSARQAIEILEAEQVDVIVSDECMPEVSGSELLCEVRRRFPDVVRIILTGQSDLDSTIRAINQAAVFRYLRKPCSPQRVAAAIREALGTQGSESAARELHDAFDTALATMDLALQPIVGALDGRTVGAEVLCRPRHPRFPGVLHLLATAERLQREPDLDRAVFERVRSIRTALSPDIDLFVNIHPRSLGDPSLLDDRSPLAPILSGTVIEVTERALITESLELHEAMAMVRSRGARIALDDLGAGHAGLAAVASLCPEVIKLDMSLIRGIDTSEVRSGIVASMVEMSRRLGARLVAEGVETPAERARVVDLGCDLLQGYLLGRPAPLADFLNNR